MTAEGGLDNVHTISAESGKSLQDNSPNAVDAGGQNIAAKSARRVLGFSTGIGVLLQLSSSYSVSIERLSAPSLRRLILHIWLEVRTSLERSTAERVS